MTPEDFAAIRAETMALHAKQKQGDKTAISLDAIFVAIAAGYDESKFRRVSSEAPPPWFTETLKKLEATDEKFNVGRFLMLAGKFPSTRSDSVNVGRWLREAGHTPRKTNGQVVFEMSQNSKPRKKAK